MASDTEFNVADSDSADDTGESSFAAIGASFLGGSGSGSSGGTDSGGSSDRDANGTLFDPEQHSGRDKFNADGSFRRKRGRKSSGSSAAPRGRSKANYQAGIESLTRVLAIVHAGLASVTKTPELELEEKEAEALSAATANVLEQFDIRPDPKIEAIIGLGIVAGGIYGPRIYLIRERKKSSRIIETNQTITNADGTVFQFHPPSMQNVN